MNIYAIGDIHGQYFKLNQLIKRLNIKDGDELVFLGDYIDRGDMSYEVIDFLIWLDRNYDCKFLIGNHELIFVDYLSGINEDIFISNGGYKTIMSYHNNGFDIKEYTHHSKRSMPEHHLEFFKCLLKYYEIEDYIFVHAGIKPGVPLNRTNSDILLWDRDFHFGPYDGKPVVFGHTPSAYVMNEDSKICVDTGACYESMGRLTAVKLPERTFISQGWTVEDVEYEENNGSTIKKDGKSFQEEPENVSSPGS